MIVRAISYDIPFFFFTVLPTFCVQLNILVIQSKLQHLSRRWTTHRIRRQSLHATRAVSCFSVRCFPSNPLLLFFFRLT